MFVHHVFFWLKKDLKVEQVQQFEDSVKSLLTISHITSGDVGIPAKTERGVIDNTYSYSLMLHFETEKDHDAYQVDPIHLQFVESCAALWERVIVYDSESI